MDLRHHSKSIVVIENRCGVLLQIRGYRITTAAREHTECGKSKRCVHAYSGDTGYNSGENGASSVMRKANATHNVSADACRLSMNGVLVYP